MQMKIVSMNLGSVPKPARIQAALPGKPCLISAAWRAEKRAGRFSPETELYGLRAASEKARGGIFQSEVKFMRSTCRGVAQPGSAPALGAGGPRFKSARPDHVSFSLRANLGTIGPL
jgi:hypothetical protein